MGLFNKLFGNKGDDPGARDPDPELRSSYNVMHSIRLEHRVVYDDPARHEPSGDGIHKDLNDMDPAKYRMTMSYVLESDDPSGQYPLEDLLDKFFLHVSDPLEGEQDATPYRRRIELGGELDQLKKAQVIIGKRVYNRDVMDNGEIRVELVIE